MNQPSPEPTSQLRTLRQSAIRARALTGTPIWRQFLDMILLRLPPGRLGSSEYYDFRLFEKGMTLAEKRRFVGWRGESALDDANDAFWHRYADDKILLHRLLIRAGQPQPALHAVHGPRRQDGADLVADGIPLLATAEELAAFLRSTDAYPLFAKPSHGGFGRGVYLFTHYDAVHDQLVQHDGQTRPVAAFAHNLADPEGLGYLFQEVLRPHPAYAHITGGRLASVRLMTLAEPTAGPDIYRVILKVPRTRNIIDNFEQGTTGNLLAQLDIPTGRVLRVLQGYGLDRKILERHPDTDVPFADLALPDWQTLQDVARACARLLPGFRFQHWDMAITDRGPVPIEVNLFGAGGVELSQLVTGRGILEPRLLAVCKGH